MTTQSLTIKCPTCGANPGEPCTSAGITHGKRRRAAEAPPSLPDPQHLGDVVSLVEVFGAIRESARACLAVSLLRHGYHLTPDELSSVVEELARNASQAVAFIELPTSAPSGTVRSDATEQEN